MQRFFFVLVLVLISSNLWATERPMNDHQELLRVPFQGSSIMREYEEEQMIRKYLKKIGARKADLGPVYFECRDGELIMKAPKGWEPEIIYEARPGSGS